MQAAQRVQGGGGWTLDRCDFRHSCGCLRCRPRSCSCSDGAIDRWLRVGQRRGIDRRPVRIRSIGLVGACCAYRSTMPPGRCHLQAKRCRKHGLGSHRPLVAWRQARCGPLPRCVSSWRGAWSIWLRRTRSPCNPCPKSASPWHAAWSQHAAPGDCAASAISRQSQGLGACACSAFFATSLPCHRTARSRIQASRVQLCAYS